MRYRGAQRTGLAAVRPNTTEGPHMRRHLADALIDALIIVEAVIIVLLLT